MPLSLHTATNVFSENLFQNFYFHKILIGPPFIFLSFSLQTVESLSLSPNGLGGMLPQYQYYTMPSYSIKTYHLIVHVCYAIVVPVHYSIIARQIPETKTKWKQGISNTSFLIKE